MSTIGNISFAIAFVAGKNLVPNPAAGITAFFTFIYIRSFKKLLMRVLANMGMVVEGVNTTQAAMELAQMMEIEMPITQTIYEVLYEQIPVTIKMSSIPDFNASSTMNWIVGLSTIGNISFAIAFVAGKNLVPNPAAGITAFYMGMVVEGVNTTQAAMELAQMMEIEMPITQTIYEVLYEQKEIKTAAKEIMLRDGKKENELKNGVS